MSRIAVNKLANRLKTKEINVDSLIDTSLRALKPATVLPSVRDNGSPLEVGDTITSLVDGFEYKYTGTGWLSTDISSLKTELLDGAFGTSIIVYKPTWSGGTPRTASLKLSERVSPYDAGAVGDGVADDSNALNKSLNSGAKIIDLCGAKIKITTPIIVPNNVTIINGEIIYSISGNNRALTVGNGFCMFNLKLKPTGNSPNAVYALGKSGFVMESCEMDFSGFTGVVPGTLLDEYSRGIYLADCSDISIRKNKFKNGWNDHLYNSSTSYIGNNMFRTINVENHGQSNVSIVENTFDNSWSPIYCSNSNYVDISHNTIRDTADTGIFERCTSGVTRYKSINFNKLYNVGKGAIKILDSNNLTGKGHNAQVIGNIIYNFALYLHTEAIFSQNYYNGTSYIEAPDNLKSSYLTVSQNQIFNEVSDSNAFGISNCNHVTITDNIVNRQFLGTKLEFISYWCKDVNFSGNDIINLSGGVNAYRNDRLFISRNNFKINGRIEIDSGSGSSGYVTKITDNFCNNITPASEVLQSYGISLPNASTGVLIGSIEVYGNRFKTTIPFEDGVQISNKNLMSVVTDANASRCFLDNNIIEFSDTIKRQKSSFGDILNPMYYSGARGTSMYNEVTRVLTIKPLSDRTSSDTTTFVD